MILHTQLAHQAVRIDLAPPLIDPTSQWTAVTLWAAILAGIGWKWIAPFSLHVDGTRCDLRDMTAEEQKTLIIFSDMHCSSESCWTSGLIPVDGAFGRGRRSKGWMNPSVARCSPVGFSCTTVGGGSVVYICSWLGAH